MDNIPLLSFLMLRGCCRYCHKRITPRYFFVELLTAFVFLGWLLYFGLSMEMVAYCLFSSALIAAFFIDWELFIIPDELNYFALFVGIGLDLWYVFHRNADHRLIGGWLPHSIAGAMLCTGIFVLIQLLGHALFRKDAMGDGDVKLARSIGALLPFSVALTSFFFAVALGAIIGGTLLLVQMRHDVEAPEQDEPDDADPRESSGMVQTLLYGGIYLFFIDVIIQMAAWMRIPPAKRFLERYTPDLQEEEEEFHPGPTHIPFGPYMVLGFFLSATMGDQLIDLYMRWAHLK
jgi:leader peptidase (prepilin peptidase)/N-methyltransferase